MATVKKIEDSSDTDLAAAETTPETQEGASNDSDQPGKQSKLPKPPSKHLHPEQFYAYTQSLTDADWAHVVMYVYRLRPVIIRDPSNIDKLSAPIDDGYFIRTHGAGTYRVLLNDIDRKATVCQTDVEISLEDGGEPKLTDLRELDVSNPKNRTWLNYFIRKGKLSKDGQVVENQPDRSLETLSSALVDMAKQMAHGRPQSDTAEGIALQKALDLVANAGKQGVELALGQVKQNDPKQFFEMITAMFTAMRSFMPQSGNEKLFEAMLKLQADAARQAAESQQRYTELLLKTLERENNPRSNSLKDTLELIMTVREFLGDSGGGSGPRLKWWQEAIPEVGRQISGITANVANIIAMNRRGQPVVPTTQTNPNAPPSLPAAPDGASPPADGQSQIDPQTRAQLQFVAQLAANALSLGLPGDQFAEQFVYQFGEGNYDRITRQYQQDQLIPMLQGLPEVWQILQPWEASLPAFVADFYGYGNEPPEGPGADGGPDSDQGPSIPPEPRQTVEMAGKRGKK